MKKQVYVFAGGGTGGHLFPAIAIAEELKLLDPQGKIIFVGTKNKIESRVVPAYGFEFKSIWISGFSRKLNFSNLVFPFKLLVSLLQSYIILKKNNPAVVIGTGGYVSGPVLKCAISMGYPTILQDHNSYPGVTTKLLAKQADEVHLAFEDAKKYLKRQNNIFISGFPIRREIKKIEKSEAKIFFGLGDDKKTIFVTGGSLGSRSINAAIMKFVKNLPEHVQIIWQTGSYEYETIKNECENISRNVKIYRFLKEMNFAYSACDFAVTRSGATTIGEIINLNVPAILVPFPFAAEDHQTKNAASLVESGASILIKDSTLSEKLVPAVNDLLENSGKLNIMKNKLESLHKSNTAKIIAERILKLANR